MKFIAMSIVVLMVLAGGALSAATAAGLVPSFSGYGTACLIWAKCAYTFLHVSRL